MTDKDWEEYRQERDRRCKEWEENRKRELEWYEKNEKHNSSLSFLFDDSYNSMVNYDMGCSCSNICYTN